MWSLRNTLATIGNHLPDGFSPSDGIRSLFPPAASVTITVLSQYVFTWTGTVYNVPDIPGQEAQIFVGADGAGRWFLGWLPPDPENPVFDGSFDQRARTGFVFLSPATATARGFIGPEQSVPNTPPPNCFCGVDGWISSNWPQAFPAGIYVDVQVASGFDHLPDQSYIWRNPGFGNFSSLQSSPCTCAVTGSTEFPFEDFPDPPPPAGGGAGDNAAEDNAVAELIGDLLGWWLG
jgi:hypothetical protein